MRAMRWMSGLVLSACAMAASAGNMDAAKPNVIMIFYDDMGYSDMGVYGDAGPTLTPNLDAFAEGALRFTAGHSADAVCTPSRYALMTGRYAWRTDLKSGVNGGYSPSLIEADRFTFAKMFRSFGYKTAMVGKWHIGMQFHGPDGAPVGDLNNNNDVLDADDSTVSGDLIDFSLAISNTPYHCGFDYYFGTAASLDMPPYAWIENDHMLFKGGMVTTNGTVDFSQAVPATNADLEEGTPTVTANSSGNIRGGVYDPNFVMEDYLQVQAAKVAQLIQARGEDDAPFFIYVPMPAPHSPWVLQDRFVGATAFHYGDYVMQADYYTGQILDALADPDGDPLTDDSVVSNTVVFISSDNGPEKFAQAASLTAGYDGNGDFRGVKRDNWEGGTRVPFLVRWPGVAAPGTTDHFCWQGDFYAAMAQYLGYDFTPDEAPDAESILPVLRGEAMPQARREGVVQHSMNGQLAIVDKHGEWKLLDGSGSGGYAATYDADNILVSNVGGTVFGEPKQLFNLLSDPGERTNLLLSAAQEHLDKEAELYALLNDYRGNDNFGTDGDSNVPFFDTDLDGLPNYYEKMVEGLDSLDPSDAALDFDSDGLTNVEDYEYGTDPRDPDTDDDALTDFEEVRRYGTGPADADSDNDSLADGDEIRKWDLDPNSVDTDGDGYTDAEELALFSNPRHAASVPARSATETMRQALSPSVVQAAGVNGTKTNPADLGGVSGGWSNAGTLYVRERRSGGSNQQYRSKLFLKFDLDEVLADEILSARLRIHQKDRLNTLYSDDLRLGRVTADWDNTSGTNYPLFASTPVADTFIFGNNADFGIASSDASGFYSGTAGVPGTDDGGFDPSGRVSSMVTNWANGTLPNHGMRIDMPVQEFTGTAFSDADDPATPDVDEELQLLVTTYATVTSDSDDDQLDDQYELDVFGSLAQAGGDDFDADGADNLIEQALGSDPTSPNSRPVQALLMDGASDVAFSYHRYVNAGLGYEVLASEDFVSWVPADAYFERPVASVAESELGPDYEKVVLEPLAGMPDHLYLRILVNTP